MVPECRGISQADPAFREGLWARDGTPRYRDREDYAMEAGAAHQEQEPAQPKLWIWCCNATLSVAMAQSSS